METPTSMSVSCISSEAECLTADVLTVISYSFTFTDVQMELTAVIPSFMSTYYDSSTCFQNIELTYNYKATGGSVINILAGG